MLRLKNSKVVYTNADVWACGLHRRYCFDTHHSQPETQSILLTRYEGLFCTFCECVSVSKSHISSLMLTG